jgi:hypothetical protein
MWESQDEAEEKQRRGEEDEEGTKFGAAWALR